MRLLNEIPSSNVTTSSCYMEDGPNVVFPGVVCNHITADVFPVLLLAFLGAFFAFNCFAVWSLCLWNRAKSLI